MVHDDGNKDHRFIMYMLLDDHTPREEIRTFKKGRCVLRRTDWELFQKCLENKLKSTSREFKDLEEKVIDITTIVAATEEAIPREDRRNKCISWWKREFEIERRRFGS